MITHFWTSLDASCVYFLRGFSDRCCGTVQSPIMVLNMKMLVEFSFIQFIKYTKRILDGCYMWCFCHFQFYRRVKTKGKYRLSFTLQLIPLNERKIKRRRKTGRWKKWTNKPNEHEYACNNNKYIYNIEWSTFEWKRMGKAANNCKLFTMKMNKQTNRRTARNQTKKKKIMWKETKQEKSLSCLAVQMWWAGVWECACCACIELCALLQRPPSKTIEITNVNTTRLTIYVFVCFALASAFYGCEIAFYESCAPFLPLLYTVVIHKL